ncbi:leucine-rich repeat neuronal protein 4 [Hemicordylus capensis]|uniref:leucine-rich repeat neuronal protein 4 n=1 Tax=Hemicordylus capensis TaxID=884348 RepID=UPI002303BD33|nr:leucine-rich repeat neuronal protein 4 [Hemicordylus capensis]XP_053140769.1 leucine-rich repeat neuronal protein 4 [Hemicordylus capensis]XP_053140770.1 leucine-rich repeat neuronal protein 4 [Hemicordylus capensis]XP_053140771.1 leucine-rich repeat neuronal protein 4 [Hemicordylus capensis]XP_053140772.1 leucine-rich repeat neuronal protein 4 [Hemicordylus capensis]XP_053140773.1 leucine-rich repeat neuronal protein 4 [Hemicordylus capensis]
MLKQQLFHRIAMSRLLTGIFLLVREVPARPTEKADPAAQGDVRALFQLGKQNVWEENVNLTSLSCAERRAQAWTTLSLRNRSLTSFPTCLPQLLEHLDLGNNLLPALNSQDVASLPKLQVLSLRQNKIQLLAWETVSLSSLQFLDLSFNLLSSVPACNASSLENLKWLSLAGNPILELQSWAFSCCPQLQFLNLSSTWLGKAGKRGIRESAFAIHLLPGDTRERAGNAIHVLDLSATFLERIHQDWIDDLPNLRSLYLTKMSRLKSLDAAVFMCMPMLRELDCQDSRELSLVKTESFNHTPHLVSLIFQNCNLSSFSPWSLSSSSNLVINLYGNPLVCHCETSWLLSKPERITLQRASETVCYTSPEDKTASSSRSMLLLKLSEECQAQRTTSPTHLFTQGQLYNTSSRVTLPHPHPFPQELHNSSFAPQSTHLTWSDVTKQDTTKPDILPYKEETVYRPSTDNSSAIGAVTTTTSMILGKLSAEQTLINTVEMDQGKHETTTAVVVKQQNSVVHPEGTLHNSALPSPTTQAVRTDSSQVPSGFFDLHNISQLAETIPPQQNPTKALSPQDPVSSNTPIYYVDDYDYGGEQEEVVAQPLGPCDYDPCRHLQQPCSELQELSPCLCPGISDELTIPEPPRLREVSEIRDTSAEIHWCAPNSAVRFYQLAYLLKGGKNYTVPGKIYATARQYTLYNLLPGSTYQVCIIASNKAGSSQTIGWNEHNAPCTNFATKSNSKSIFAALSATSGLFLIATILLSGCLCKKRRTSHPEQFNTHLVSYKNPAFDYALK